MKWSETDNSLEYALEEINSLKASIQRVRELHKPKELYNPVKGWQICSSCFNDLEPYLYPCPTIKALDGEQ
jgi:hypothetical protein